jgi:hypothetical protein
LVGIGPLRPLRRSRIVRARCPNGNLPRAEGKSMKVTINIDCTPQEARSFLGLPDVEAMQKAMMEKIQDEMAKAMTGMDPQALFEQWLPAGMKGMEQMQKAFWDGLAGQSGTRTSKD